MIRCDTCRAESETADGWLLDLRDATIRRATCAACRSRPGRAGPSISSRLWPVLAVLGRALAADLKELNDEDGR